MNFNLSVLELELKIRQERIELTNNYLLNQGIKPSLLTEEDKASIYSMLIIKAEKFKKEHIDKLY